MVDNKKEYMRSINFEHLIKYISEMYGIPLHSRRMAAITAKVTFVTDQEHIQQRVRP